MTGRSDRTQLLPFMDADAVGLFGAFESAVYEMA
jgi:hypothetical protein